MSYLSKYPAGTLVRHVVTGIEYVVAPLHRQTRENKPVSETTLYHAEQSDWIWVESKRWPGLASAIRLKEIELAFESRTNCCQKKENHTNFSLFHLKLGCKVCGTEFKGVDHVQKQS